MYNALKRSTAALHELLVYQQKTRSSTFYQVCSLGLKFTISYHRLPSSQSRAIGFDIQCDLSLHPGIAAHIAYLELVDLLPMPQVPTALLHNMAISGSMDKLFRRLTSFHFSARLRKTVEGNNRIETRATAQPAEPANNKAHTFGPTSPPIRRPGIPPYRPGERSSWEPLTLDYSWFEI